MQGCAARRAWPGQSVRHQRRPQITGRRCLSRVRRLRGMGWQPGHIWRRDQSVAPRSSGGASGSSRGCRSAQNLLTPIHMSVQSTIAGSALTVILSIPGIHSGRLAMSQPQAPFCARTSRKAILAGSILVGMRIRAAAQTKPLSGITFLLYDKLHIIFLLSAILFLF